MYRSNCPNFIGPFFVTKIVFLDVFFILAVCCLGAAGHYLMIKSFQNAEASLLQPFIYLHLVFVSFIGIFIFDENIDLPILIGSIIVIGAGLYTFWRERIVESKLVKSIYSYLNKKVSRYSF